jgi:hypothetical protein
MSEIYIQFLQTDFGKDWQGKMSIIGIDFKTVSCNSVSVASDHCDMGYEFYQILPSKYSVRVFESAVTSRNDVLKIEPYEEQ